MPLPRPSEKRLNKLLMTNPAKFERYLVAYPDIADSFEAANPLSGVGTSVRRALDSAFDVPNDLAIRLRARIKEAQTETTPLAIALDLAGIGVATLGILALETPLTEDPEAN